MKNPISLAMPAEATFTALLVCAKDGKSARPAAARARQNTAPPAVAAAKRDLEAGLRMNFRLPVSVFANASRTRGRDDGACAGIRQRGARAVSHRPETETALAFLHCRIFGRKTGFHFS
jgi:hypothetical protein